MFSLGSNANQIIYENRIGYYLQLEGAGKRLSLKL